MDYISYLFETYQYFIVPLLLPLSILAVYLRWKTKRKLENIRKHYSSERLERYEKGPKK